MFKKFQKFIVFVSCNFIFLIQTQKIVVFGVLLRFLVVQNVLDSSVSFCVLLWLNEFWWFYILLSKFNPVYYRIHLWQDWCHGRFIWKAISRKFEIQCHDSLLIEACRLRTCLNEYLVCFTCFLILHEWRQVSVTWDVSNSITL